MDLLPCFPTVNRTEMVLFDNDSCLFVAAEGEGWPTAYSRELDDLTTGTQHRSGRTPSVSIRGILVMLPAI